MYSFKINFNVFVQLEDKWAQRQLSCLQWNIEIEVLSDWIYKVSEMTSQHLYVNLYRNENHFIIISIIIITKCLSETTIIIIIQNVFHSLQPFEQPHTA